jgi:hypothetical protein
LSGIWKQELELKPDSEGEGRRPSFEAAIEKSIEEGLQAILGQSGLQMVLSLHPLDSLSSDPARFHEVLKGIFMSSGAAIIERETARRLVGHLGGGLPRQSWLASAAWNANPLRRASKREKKLIREFVELASEPEGYLMELDLKAPGRTRAGGVELTSLTFASAFKK